MGIKERWKRFPPLPPDIRQKLKRLDPVFKENRVVLAYLFGSLSAGKAAEDVDIAVLTETGESGDLRRKIAETLGTERIDLLNLAAASPVLRFEVLRTGRLIYKQNDEVENNFELAVLREYKDTAYLRNRQRKILKQRIEQWSSNKKEWKKRNDEEDKKERETPLAKGETASPSTERRFSLHSQR